MSDITIQSAAPVHGLRAVEVASDLLRLVILPELGAKIWQIQYRPAAADLLWNNPSLAPARQSLHASYDDTWSGGWDELFPNDAAGEWSGYKLPDHGELWSGEWQDETVMVGDVLALRLSYTTPLTHFQVEKTLILRPDLAVLEINYKLTNRGTETFPFLFKLHPAFAVSASHRIDFAPMTVHLEPEFPGTLEGAPHTFAWPHARIGGKSIDLRQVPAEDSGAVHFFYGAELGGGWCGVTNRANRLAAALRFDPAVFSSCWLFATHGGWRDLNVAVLEPGTGYPYNFHSMIEGGNAFRLGPGETLETSVLFSVEEGFTSIGGVDENGRILPGAEY
jgi:galactose mutarotase-like enzyme